MNQAIDCLIIEQPVEEGPDCCRGCLPRAAQLDMERWRGVSLEERKEG